ncbi:FAD-dependent oxidoreductase [Candidatus Babeliales bacterium]|nr:FAD-dependent oxidoreductase [Candidatus Babeliales bacterium]
MSKVVILGAGLTGLSTAYHLEKNKFSNYKIFEQDNTPGGLCKSIKQDGFIFDYTGHLLHINDEYFKTFLDSALGLENLNLIQRRSFVFSNETFTHYPFQTNLYGLPNNVISECIKGFVNRKTKIRKPKNFHEWVLKHFGNGIGKHFHFPFQKKLFSYDIKKVLPSWTGRFVPSTSLKSIVEGALEDKAKKVGYNSSFYYPKSNGIQTLPNLLLRQLQNKVLTNHKVSSIDLKNKIVFFENGHQESYNILVSTLPLNVFLKMSKEKSSTNLKSATNKLVCNSLINFNLGFNVGDLTTKHWIYVPESKYAFYRIGFWHNFSENMAPKGHSSLYGEFSHIPGTKTKKQLENLTQKCVNQTLSILGLSKQNIVIQKNLHLKHAYVIYDAWREKNLKKLHKKLNEESVYSVGRFGEWKYSSMQEAVLDGKIAAETIVNKTFLAASKTSLEKNIISQQDKKEATL